MRIAELEALSGLSRHTIRYYERHGVIEPPRRDDNRYRDYPESVVEELTFVRRAQQVGFPLSEISEILQHLRDRTIDCVRGAELVDARLADVERRLTELQNVRRDLVAARQDLLDSAIAHGHELPDGLRAVHRT